MFLSILELKGGVRDAHGSIRSSSGISLTCDSYTRSTRVKVEVTHSGNFTAKLSPSPHNIIRYMLVVLLHYVKRIWDPSIQPNFYYNAICSTLLLLGSLRRRRGRERLEIVWPLRCNTISYHFPGRLSLKVSNKIT